MLFQEAHSKCEKLHAVVIEAEARTKELEQHCKIKLDEANRQPAERNEDEVKFQYIFSVWIYVMINSAIEMTYLIFE